MLQAKLEPLVVLAHRMHIYNPCVKNKSSTLSFTFHLNYFSSLMFVMDIKNSPCTGGCDLPASHCYFMIYFPTSCADIKRGVGGKKTNFRRHLLDLFLSLIV